ncbi:MAG: hypothetical protein A2Y17_06135 [Clostridiales bacterium GWF2_38_85]|nr:MAG: hypothetical protein A2Y17_06135 [Clostridiales bacterium GWF2_38_85]HBL85472.1 bifunctional homocysteine S-methyltransferase/methylenetetrahydrofolate reductase [Clostridiales bacterium]
MNIREYIKNNKLIFDGAMGTYYASLYNETTPCELALLEHPERIVRIHNEYIEAGAKAIKTNSFGANTTVLEGGITLVDDIIEKSWTAALAAVGKAKNKDIYIFADIGYITGDNAEVEYRHIAEKFLLLGATNFLFETLPDVTNAIKTAEFIKSISPDVFIIISVAAAPDGYTRQGESAAELLKLLCEDRNTDTVGLNCVSGPAHLLKFIKQLPSLKKPLSIMPNSGYPTVVGGRTYYPDGAKYFAEQIARIAQKADIIGGCCGTTPEYIFEAFKSLSSKVLDLTNGYSIPAIHDAITEGKFLKKLKSGKKVIAVELDPPSDADITPFIKGSGRLKSFDIDVITIADCPVARVRADSSMLAAKLKREFGIDTVPHMTCRDRNINATKALLLGLGIEGVENVLVVTGDPIPSANRDEIKGVYSFNSVVLAKYIKLLGEQTGKRFTVGGALNVNAPNFTAELRKAERKVEAGVDFFLTQPIFTDKAIENLKLAHNTLNAFILGGIIPIVSYRNALFMQNEMSGIDIPDSIVEQYNGLDRETAEILAVRISNETIEKIKNFCNGYYLITPFSRVELIGKILKNMKL